MALNLQSFRKTLRYEATVPIPQLQVHLKQLAHQDQIAEKKSANTPFSVFSVVFWPFSPFFSLSNHRSSGY